MTKDINDLAFSGNWAELMPILRLNPVLANSPSEQKGYTALHQAAWHGASLDVVGELLSLGADRGLRTRSRQQTAHDIAVEKHRDRDDLKYILVNQGCSIAQLMRKVVAENAELFGSYDGNQLVFDRLIECFGLDTFLRSQDELLQWIEAAFFTVTGVSLSSSESISYGPDIGFSKAETSFWKGQFLPILIDLASRSHLIPIERHWGVISDLFEPAPDQWGLRGDLFLWIEMRQALCHVKIPETSDELAKILSAAFTALTCKAIGEGRPFSVERFSRGGMSGGSISCEFWREKFIPLMQQRLVWLRNTWRC
jgi:hypothetical protein